ncbi:transcriptional regulator family: bZIP [Purpureocillium lilacinum]|uniref:Transcriptional regulator family: bZIP n=1 Tax=Purpureocillium lilacinum TaxID=33203 RepID=A0ABR0BG89_PURLI|nr:transcriptional regulator family: bZIP [Purpureocillium lilacinum]
MNLSIPGVDSLGDPSLNGPATGSLAKMTLGITASSGPASLQIKPQPAKRRGRPQKRRTASATSNVKLGRRTAAQKDADVAGSEDPRARSIREKNRIAADKCRSRRRLEEEKLKHRHEILEEENHRLLAGISDLMAETYVLKNMLTEHGSCDCRLIHKYMAESASEWVAKKLGTSYSPVTLQGGGDLRQHSRSL